MQRLFQFTAFAAILSLAFACGRSDQPDRQEPGAADFDSAAALGQKTAKRAPEATEGEPLIESRVFVSKNGSTMPYRILRPANYKLETKYPLVLCLHGAAGRGTDNKSRGTRAFGALSSPEVQKAYPAFLLTPQCPNGKRWVGKQMELVLEILESVKNEFSIDPARVYVTGQSMGAYGTWYAILHHPHLFAAAVPVCGGGDPSLAERIAHVPIWAFHGEKDNVVSPDVSKEMYEALKRVGGKIRYTEYPSVGHDSWSKAWAEQELIPWLYQQHKKPDAGDAK